MLDSGMERLAPMDSELLQCLLMSADDKAARVLRRVLSDLEISTEHCLDAESAVQKLTRQRFDAIIVDCTTRQIASAVLQGARSAPVNKRAITVAIIDQQSPVKGAFELGAHFVLFRPITTERTKSCFRSVRALMKRERRRHVRIPVELRVELECGIRSLRVQARTVDVGENGMAIRATNGPKLTPSFRVRLFLPGKEGEIHCRGEVAWENNELVGIRFREISEAGEVLKAWIDRQLTSPEQQEDPPVICKLSDLSPSACYLQTESPFPLRTRLKVMMKVGEGALQIEGIVRIMHPATGMGIEFAQNSAAAKAGVEQLINALVDNFGTIPELQVLPDTIDNSPSALSQEPMGGNPGDPLLLLFRTKADLAAEVFLAELRKRRGAQLGVGAS